MAHDVRRSGGGARLSDDRTERGSQFCLDMIGLFETPKAQMGVTERRLSEFLFQTVFHVVGPPFEIHACLSACLPVG